MSALSTNRISGPLYSLLTLCSEDPSDGEHAGAEEAPDGPGHLYENRRLSLHRHLLRSLIPRGTVLLLIVDWLHSAADSKAWCLSVDERFV